MLGGGGGGGGLARDYGRAWEGKACSNMSRQLMVLDHMAEAEKGFRVWGLGFRVSGLGFRV